MVLPSYMHAIQQTYRGLLADVSRLSGFSEIRGSDDDLHWGINCAPKLEKDVLECLTTGREIDLSRFPKSLRNLTAASLKGDASMLRLLRQLLLFSYKAQVPHDNQKTEQAFIGFVTTNEQVGRFGNELSRLSPSLLRRVRSHVQSVLYKADWRGIIPSHGPGASTTPKEEWSRWYSTIESRYPYSDYFALYWSADSALDIETMTDDHIKAKLIAVPKDSRGPRLICVHPAESIWIQQGLRRELERVISLQRYHPGIWPRGHVHFDDQSVNGQLALSSSLDRKFATLDMKEASDRISEPLVQILFGDHYKWFGCCRAQKYYTPKMPFGTLEGDIHSYAPMGNATTFPVQSLVFWAICVASMQSRGFHQADSVFVFGDDIIVPTEQARHIIDDLESFGLIVNKAKSFIDGSFRESCGIDAFNGSNVTPVRWKTTPDAERLSDMQSLSDLAMRLRLAGYEEAAIATYDTLRARLQSYSGRQLFITNNVNHGGIVEYSDLGSATWRDAYWHRDTQQFVSPVYRLQEHSIPRVLHGRNHVLESLCSLERTGRSNVPDRRVSRRVVLNRGWIPVT